MLGYSYGKRFGSKTASANRRKGERVGVGSGIEQVVKAKYPHGGHGQICELYMACVGVVYGMAEVKLLCYR